MAPKAAKYAVTTSGKQGHSISSSEVKNKSSYHDKQSGSYGRVTTKQSVSSGDYTNRGRDGHKYEYKASSTARIGDKRGYTEYSKEEKFTRVDYDGGNNNSGGNRVCGGPGGGYGNYGYSSDGADAPDDDDYYSSEGGACCEDDDNDVDANEPSDYDVDEDDPCDDTDDFDDDDDNGDFDDNDEYDDDGGDDDCCYDSDY